jgi:hypothetical protein
MHDEVRVDVLPAQPAPRSQEEYEWRQRLRNALRLRHRSEHSRRWARHCAKQLRLFRKLNQ